MANRLPHRRNQSDDPVLGTDEDARQRRTQPAAEQLGGAAHRRRAVQLPVTVASDVGTMGLDEVEAERLRTYLLKGGFLWVDDFWGESAWAHWENEIAKALPPSEFPIEDLPLEQSVFKGRVEVPRVPADHALSSSGRRGTGAKTSERGEDSGEAALPRHPRSSRPHHRRHDAQHGLADSWEREGEEPGYFATFSVVGYPLGVNVLLYALTH